MKLKLEKWESARRSWLTGLLFLLVSGVFGQTNLKETYTAKLRAFSQETQTIKSDFVQTQYLALLLEPQISSGVFYYSKPDQLRWEQILPKSYIIIFNKKDVIKIDGKNREVNPGGNMQTEGFRKFILGVINGSIFESKDFDSFFVKEGSSIKIDLIPKQKMVKNIFDKISLTFDESTVLLKELTFTEKNGDIRKMVFSNHQLNMKNLDSKFE